jgi:YggT family protein
LFVSLLVFVIDIYIILLFVRLFLSEYERYDAVLDMVFQATDPVIVPLATTLRSRAVQLVPLLLIAILLLLKGMIIGSIPGALQGFLSRLLQIYVLTIIITAAFREAYLNPIVSFGQRMVRPVRNIARYLSPHPTTVDVLSAVILVILHTIVLLVLDNIAGNSMAGGGGDDLLLVKYRFVYSLGLIVDLTWFFVIVLFLYVLLSWFSPDPRNPIVQLLTTIAIPILEPLRRVIPPVGGVIDLSPMIAIFALYIVHDLLYGLLRYLV